MTRKEIEIPFQWKCPECGKVQHDTVNPELGPFVNLSCAECGKTTDDDSLDPASLASWEAARVAAESHLT